MGFNNNFNSSGGATVLTDLEVDGTTVVVDETNDRVGIGTDSPDGRLHVMKGSAGSVTASGDGNALVVESDDVAGMTLLSPGDGVIYFGDAADNDEGRIVYKHSDNSMNLWTNNAVRLTIDSSGDATFTGDVTVSGGDATLGTAGNTTATTISTIVNTGTTVGKSLTIAAGSTTTGANNLNGGDLILSSGSGDGTGTSSIQLKTKVSGTDVAAERMRIHTNGKVGIGTAAPTSLLTLSAEDAYIALQNTTAENGDGGAETRILFVDHAGNALAQIEGSHSGSSDDDKGKLVFSTNNASDADPQPAVTIDDTQKTTFAGTASLAEAQSLNISTPLLATTNDTSTGITANMVCSAAIAIRNLVAVSSADKVANADANAEASMPVIGMALNATASDGDAVTVLLRGMVRHDTWNWTAGNRLFASGDSTTTNGLTATAPSTTGDFVQCVAVALSDDVIYLNPSFTLVEVG